MNIDLEPQLSLESVSLGSREFWSLINEEEEGAGRVGCELGLGCTRAGGLSLGF